MGNMMIQPMTYFDLQGVPMFSGAYLITEVSHSVKPNNVSTTFKGVRQPRTIVPLVTSASIAMNLTFDETATGTGTGASLRNIGRGANVDMSLYPDISQGIFKLFGNPVLCINKPIVTSQIYRSETGDFHGGLDIGFSNPDSGDTAKVISAFNGVVTNIGEAKGFGAPPDGGWIIVRYGENNGEDPFSDGYYYFYVYGHCDANSDITVNTKVNIGKELGKAVWPNKDSKGNPVRNTGLHLHLQIHRLKSKGWSPDGKIDGSRFLNNKENCIGNVNLTVPTFALGYGSNVPQSTKINDVEKSENQVKTKNFLKSKGLNQIETAAIMGNIQTESGFNPGALNAKDLNGYASFGLIQWNQKYYQPSDVGNTVDNQLNYLTTMPTYKKWLTQVKKAKNVDEATWYFAEIVEVCDKCNKGYDIYKKSYQYKRSLFALDFYNRMKDSNDSLYWG
jgi:murein DD-endopeptidase MepM/ murein hydrolase activator NlpD